MNKVITPPHLGDCKPSVSIILPVYNGEKTVDKIIRECLNQTYTNTELIIVNDGSTDSTASIISQYQEDKRVTILSQPNGGVSVARNAGIAASKGKYITFVDADDEIKPGFIENLVCAAIAENSDLVVAGYVKLPHGSVMLEESSFDRDRYQHVIMTKDIGVTFCKLYDADIIRSHGVAFPPRMKVCEDAVFYYRYLLYSERCIFINTQDYMYYAPTGGDAKYNVDIESEFVGFEAMKDALINLINYLNLDKNGYEHLRQRLLLHLRRLLYAIISKPKLFRAKLYKRIDWSSLFKYIKTDFLTKSLLRHNLFSLFEIKRITESKFLKRNLESTFS